MLRISGAVLTALIPVAFVVTVGAQAPGALAPPSGDAARGKTLYDTTLRCYSCHGFDGQTGSPRLVPMKRTEDIFLAYVRKPATQGMPSFASAPEQDLRDLYAYVRSLPEAAPDLDSLPLLKGLIERRSKTN